MHMSRTIHKHYKPRFFFPEPQILTKIPAFGRAARILEPNGCSMATSIAHTMMGPGLGENGCVLWINGKKIIATFGGL